jgi:hypothetical protein
MKIFKKKITRTKKSSVTLDSLDVHTGHFK